MASAARRFEVRTTGRRFEILAESAGHARAIVTGRAMPYGVPPAPDPAERPCRRRDGECEPFEHTHTTAAWLGWFREHQPRLRDERIGGWLYGEGLAAVTDLGPAAGQAETSTPATRRQPA